MNLTIPIGPWTNLQELAAALRAAGQQLIAVADAITSATPPSPVVATGKVTR